MAEDCSQTSVLPERTALYLEPSYWNDRFAREGHYEWFKDYSHFRHLIHSHIKTTDRVLEIGCGNSRMGEEMYNDGITQITRTDLSPIAIRLMQDRSVAEGFEGIEYKVADMLDLPFDNNSFDIVIEKGTVLEARILVGPGPKCWKCHLEDARKLRGYLIFAVLHARTWMLNVCNNCERTQTCISIGALQFVDNVPALPEQVCHLRFLTAHYGHSGDPWKPKPEVAQRVQKMLVETHRVLTATGMFISIAFGQPHFRQPIFEAEGLTWSMKWETFGNSFHYFFYTLRKGTKSLHQGPSVSLPSAARVVFDTEHEFMDNEDYLLHSMLGDDE